jgi:hypothetical protein
MNDKTEPLACENKKFPPIEVRCVVLRSCAEAGLLTWAEHLGIKATTKEEAVLAILSHEFGEEKVSKLRARLADEKEQFEAKREQVRKDAAAAQAKSDVERGFSRRDLKTEAEAKLAAQRQPTG